MEPIIMVAGLGRCGSSLVMQMLSAGGVPCIGGYPGFEDLAHHEQRAQDPHAWAASSAGKAVKVLDPQRAPPPPGYAYRTIILQRDPTQQADSMLKLIDYDRSRTMRRGMRASLSRDIPKMLQALPSDHRCKLFFERILAEPTVAARAIAGHLRMELDVEAMARCVVPRGPRCLSGMLEHQLVASAR